MKERALHVLLVEDNAGDARLLREMFSKEKPDSFHLTHLLRMTDAEGKRILGQLRHSGQLQAADFDITVCHSFLEPLSRDSNESTETFVRRVAVGVQDLINQKSLEITP